ncbi:MAG: undecaprenyl diphosphate synthase [Halieaceae bacterium]|jgi:undecaprenyl diphosphate synthase
MTDKSAVDRPSAVPSPVTPRHVAIIMDGNNRWAQQHNLPGPAGHRAGVEAVRGVMRACREHGVEVLTLFAFSSENWLRPVPEVRALLALLSRYLRTEVKQLHEDNVRLKFIGQRSRFSPGLQRLMTHAEKVTADNSKATVVIAVDYGGQWDITRAARELAERCQSGDLQTADITTQLVQDTLSLGEFPPPELCIRTGGDARISNFLLWDFAYSELYFTPVLWPDFGELEFARALADYSRRERRFGGRGEPDGILGLGQVIGSGLDA